MQADLNHLFLASAMGIENQFGSFAAGSDEMQADVELFPYNEYLSPTSFLPPSPQHPNSTPSGSQAALPTSNQPTDIPPVLVTSYAPDSAPSSDVTKIIVVLRMRDGSQLPPIGPTDLKCIFDGQVRTLSVLKLLSI